MRVSVRRPWPRNARADRDRAIRRTICSSIACLAGGLLLAPSAFADATITSSGPLTSITITSDLNCAVNHTGDTSGEFYGDTACGTFVTTGGSNYGPASVPAGNSGNPAYTPVSQTPVTGSGTGADPYKIITVVDLGTSGLRLTETDTYVVGSESYQTDFSIKNNGTSTQTGFVYRAGDCYLQDSDTGYGAVDPTTGAVSCVNAVSDGMGGTVPGTRIEQWYPLTAGSHYVEDGYATVWADTIANANFADTCQCTSNIDNGGGLSWALSVPAGGTVTYSNLITFSPVGHLPLTTTKTADSATATASGSDGYTITMSNPNSSAVSLDSLSDALPAGFSYTTGSSTGATTTDPSVSGQTLTWAGPISVPAASGGTPGTVTLHFGVTVSGSNGTFYNNAGGSAAGYTIVATGNTAPVTVSGGSGESQISGNGVAVSATEGQSFTNTKVATFTDPDTAATAAEYTATIDWGDGSTSAGAITAGTTAGSFDVTGGHTYAEHGSFMVTVTVTDADTPSNTISPTATATVAEQLLSPTAVSFGATEGHAFSGSVATFTDGDAGPAASEYSATIAWGDGTTSAGTITGSAGSFTVTGGHTYAEHGSYQVKVTVQETDNASTATSSTGTATVAEQALNATASAVGATEGQAFSGAVGGFTDGDTAPAASEYSATIDWGDGSAATSGTVSGSAGSFTVNGSHTYSEKGSYTVKLTVQEADNAATATSSTATATVADAALSASGKGTLSTAPAFSGGVATFTDGNPSAPLSDFSGTTINWGDGSAATAGTVSGSGGSYVVGGSHTYGGAGTFTATVTITDVDGSHASATTTIVVAATPPANTPPVCTAVTATPATLWPPNDKFKLVTLAGATDSDGDSLAYTITGVTQDEAVFGTGDTGPDAKAGPTPNSVYLRAERRGGGTGRLYFIAFTVSDGHGNRCTGSVTVTVPHDQRRHHHVTTHDTGRRFNSFSTPPPPHHHHH